MSTLPEPDIVGSDLIVDQPDNLGYQPVQIVDRDTEKAVATAEVLIAKAIAPVKKQFLCTLPIKSSSKEPSNDAVLDTKPSSNASVLKEKKSKRQAKRERKQVLFTCIG